MERSAQPLPRHVHRPAVEDGAVGETGRNLLRAHVFEYDVSESNVPLDVAPVGPLAAAAWAHLALLLDLFLLRPDGETV